MIWAAYMLVAWRREATRLAFDWKVLNYEVCVYRVYEYIACMSYAMLCYAILLSIYAFVYTHIHICGICVCTYMNRH